MSERVESLLADLTMALQAQTEALNQLVISNMAMVDAMTSSGGSEDGNAIASPSGTPGSATMVIECRDYTVRVVPQQ